MNVQFLAVDLELEIIRNRNMLDLAIIYFYDQVVSGNVYNFTTLDLGTDGLLAGLEARVYSYLA